jgi:fluoroquinolone resistance protein
MSKILYENKTFTKVDYTETSLSGSEFDNCIFISCNFTKNELSNCDFMDCRFEDCNFSMTKLCNTGLKTVSFTHCKMLGSDFSRCKDFLLSFRFEKCSLDYASFHQKKITKTVFKECSIKEADFTGADLSSAVFQECDLSRTIFFQTRLEKADLRTAHNFSIDPELNRIKNAKFSAAGIIGLLDKYQIIVE